MGLLAGEQVAEGGWLAAGRGVQDTVWLWMVGKQPEHTGEAPRALVRMATGPTKQAAGGRTAEWGKVLNSHPPQTSWLPSPPQDYKG